MSFALAQEVIHNVVESKPKKTKNFKFRKKKQFVCELRSHQPVDCKQELADYQQTQVNK